MTSEQRRSPGTDLILLEKPSEEFLCWFAGYWEGEGHVGENVFNVVQAGDNGEEQIMMVKRRFGGAGQIYEREHDNPKWSTKYKWAITHPKAIKQILEWIQPYLDVNTKASDRLEHFGIKETIPVWERKDVFSTEQIYTSVQQAHGNAVSLSNKIQRLEEIEEQTISESDPLYTHELEQKFVCGCTQDVSYNEFIDALSTSVNLAIEEHPVDGVVEQGDITLVDLEIHDKFIAIVLGYSDFNPGYVPDMVGGELTDRLGLEIVNVMWEDS